MRQRTDESDSPHLSRVACKIQVRVTLFPSLKRLRASDSFQAPSALACLSLPLALLYAMLLCFPTNRMILGFWRDPGKAKTSSGYFQPHKSPWCFAAFLWSPFHVVPNADISELEAPCVVGLVPILSWHSLSKCPPHRQSTLACLASDSQPSPSTTLQGKKTKPIWKVNLQITVFAHRVCDSLQKTAITERPLLSSSVWLVFRQNVL